MDVGDHNAGARSIVLELGNDGVGFGNSDICIYCKLCLECRVSNRHTEMMERTLKI